MHPDPRIIERASGQYIGIRMEMSLMEDNTGILWRQFMPRRQEILHRTNTDFVSLQHYPKDFFSDFDPARSFSKWALVEVEEVSSPLDEDQEQPGSEDVPEGMEVYTLSGGLYAVFVHQGSDPAIFDHIYGIWLPASEYELDDRPHFEVLDAQYRHSDPDAAEEIWIPVRFRF